MAARISAVFLIAIWSVAPTSAKTTSPDWVTPNDSAYARRLPGDDRGQPTSKTEHYLGYGKTHQCEFSYSQTIA